MPEEPEGVSSNLIHFFFELEITFFFFGVFVSVSYPPVGSEEPLTYNLRDYAISIFGKLFCNSHKRKWK